MMASPNPPRPERKPNIVAAGPPKPSASPPSARDTQRPTDSTPMQSGSFAKLPMRFGRYQIERLLGKGNMGAVYLAMDTQLGRKVAIKIPKVSASGSQKLLKRLETEAKAAAQVEHPSVCPVYDWGQIDGTAYIAMQYVEGETLKDHLKAHSKTPQEAVALIVQLAEGLAEAHARKICHRDLKPDNIKLNKRGVPVIMDFGLAKLTSRQSSDASATQAGTTLGTPAYMSPEQANGQIDRIDHRSDIYALGVIFYEMLTGRWPFMGSAMQVMGQKTMQEAPSPLSVKPDLDPRLAAICHKMLAKKQEERYGTAEDVNAALKQVAGDRPGTRDRGPGGSAESGLAGLQSLVLDDPYSEFLSRNAQKQSDAETSGEHSRMTAAVALTWIKKGGPAIWTGIAVALLFFVGVGIWASGLIKVQTKEGVLVVEVNEPGAEVFVDGEQVDVTWGKGNKAEIRVKPGQRRISIRKDGFSVEGKTLTFAAGDTEVFKATLVVKDLAEAAEGTQPQRPGPPGRDTIREPQLIASSVLTGHKARVVRVQFTPDGTRLVSGSNGNCLKDGIKWGGPDNSVRVWNIASEKQIRRFDFTAPGRVFGTQGLSVSPDGQFVAACTSWNVMHPWMCPWTYVWKIDTSERTQFFKLEEQVFLPAVSFSENGSALRVAHSNKQIASWSLPDGATLDAKQFDQQCFPLAFALNGELLIGGDNVGKVWVWNANTGQTVACLAGHVKPPVAAAVSNDGLMVLSCAGDFSIRAWELKTGTEVMQVSGLDENITCVAYSPNGKRFLTGTEQGEVILRDANSGKVIANVPGHSGRINSVAFAPSGRLAASGGDDMTIRLWQLP